MALFNINQIYRSVLGTIGEPLPTGGQDPREGAVVRSPLTVAVDGQTYTFPFEPLISVYGHNNLIRNSILKGRGKGTVKEYWSADDYSIEIKGMLIGEDRYRFPTEDLNKIRVICEAKKTVEVSSPYLTIWGIQYMAIESFEFLHTAGYNNQAYAIKGYSDEPFELF